MVTSHYLKATNFGFTIPEGATINGILVEIERKAQYINQVIDSEVKIVKSDGAIGTTNKASGTAWSTTEAYFSYGAADDLWGEAWTSADINHANFGMVLSVTLIADIRAYVDHIRITVYYTEAAVGTNMQINIAGTLKDVSEMKINISDVLKDVIEVKQNIGGVLKDVF